MPHLINNKTRKRVLMKTHQVWANLPASDVEATKAFYTALGFTINGEGGDKDQLASFIVGETDFVVHFFAEAQFGASSEGKIADTAKGSEIMFTLSADSHDEVDEWARAVEKAGGTVFSAPKSVMDNDDWYGCGFADPDGHKWNVFFNGG